MSNNPNMSWTGRIGMLWILTLGFFLPLALHGAWWMGQEHASSWSTANWSSAAILPTAAAHPTASVMIFAAPTGRWKGIFSLHTWIVLKEAGAPRYTRYDVVGWGRPVHVDERAPDAYWYGHTPKIVARFEGAEAERLLPRFREAIAAYPYQQAGAYRVWPGPNSNTFVASLLAAVPEANVNLPSNAIGRDWRGIVYIGPSVSRTGVQISLAGLLGLTVGWIEGAEVNVLGLVAGIDFRKLAIKLPGWGEIGLRSALRI